MVDGNLGPPTFDEEIPDVTLNIGDVYKFNLPSWTDPDKDAVSVKINIGGVSLFAIKTGLNNYIFKPTIEQAIGNYTISITLKDDNIYPKQTLYSVKVSVLGNLTSADNSSTTLNSTYAIKVPQDEYQDEVKYDDKNQSVILRSCILKIKEINQIGIITLQIFPV